MKHMRSFTALVLALVMVFSLTVSASAATAQQVTVTLSPNITVTLDGKAQAMTDVNGKPVYPVLYGGTTYLPIRAVGNMLGLDVGWEQAAKTVLLTDSGSTTPAAGGAAPSGGSPTSINVTIDPGITVKYNGEAQAMKDTNGNPVYPMLYGGTTYLPVRAVSNMLGIDVDWNGNIQTVVLARPTDTEAIYVPDEEGVYGRTTYGDGVEVAVMHDEIEIKYSDGKTETFAFNELSIVRATLKEMDRLDESIDRIIQDFIDVHHAPPFEVHNPFSDQYTSEDAKVLGDKHIGYDWGEIDWSTASKGYVRVKIDTELVTPVKYTLMWCGKTGGSGIRKLSPYISQTNGWQNIPLYPSGGEYEYLVSLMISRDGSNSTLQARFTAKIDNPDNIWLISTAKINYENAPNTCAKALALTKNCKTDAEKVAAIFNYVATTICYDYGLSKEIIAYNEKVKADKNFNEPFKDGTREYPALDNILSTKTGVCEDYAVLTAGMLRSIGVPCKYVSGEANFDGEWVPHAWVVVKPETGTLNISGAGKDYAGYDAKGKPTDPTGWIRLDPTNTHIPNKTSNDNNYKTSEYY